MKESGKNTSREIVNEFNLQCRQQSANEVYFVLYVVKVKYFVNGIELKAANEIHFYA
jgi:hypothetical protein